MPKMSKELQGFIHTHKEVPLNSVEEDSIEKAMNGYGFGGGLNPRCLSANIAIPFGVPSPSGRFYSFETLLRGLIGKNRRLVITDTLSTSIEIDLERVVGQVDSIFYDKHLGNTLWANVIPVGLWSNPESLPDTYQDIVSKQNSVLMPRGTATMKGGHYNIVSDYNAICLDFINADNCYPKRRWEVSDEHLSVLLNDVEKLIAIWRNDRWELYVNIVEGRSVAQWYSAFIEKGAESGLVIEVER